MNVPRNPGDDADDHPSVTSPLPERDLEALLRGEPVIGERALSSFLDALRATAEEPAPAPSAELAALLETDELTRRRRSRWLLAAPLAVAMVGGTVGAAAANVLPAPVQRVVEHTVPGLTHTRPRPAPPAVTPTVTPAHAPAPLPPLPSLPPTAQAPQHRPTAHPTAQGKANQPHPKPTHAKAKHEGGQPHAVVKKTARPGERRGQATR